MKQTSVTTLVVGLACSAVFLSATRTMGQGLLQEAISRSKQTGLPMMMVASGGCGT